MLVYTSCVEDTQQHILEETALNKGGVRSNVEVIKLDYPERVQLGEGSQENVKASREIPGEGNPNSNLLGRFNAELKVFGCMNDGTVYAYYEENSTIEEMTLAWLKDVGIAVEYLEIESVEHEEFFCPCGELLHIVKVQADESYLDKLAELGFEKI